MKSQAKRLVAVAAIALAAKVVLAADSYLYWMVENAHYADYTPVEFDYATIRDNADAEPTYLTWGSGSDSKVYASYYFDNTLSHASSGRVYTNIGEAGAISTFLVELWSAGDVVGYQTYEYAQLLAAGNILYDSTAEAGATPHVVSQVVPEPTSGLLMLFGLAGLALRRKRA